MAYHGIALSALVSLHRHVHGVINPVHFFLALFCITNAWICICEIALFVHQKEIKRQHACYTATYGVGVLPDIFLFQPVTVVELFSLKYWAFMWSQYAALDRSYVDTESFGYCVDVSNGWTTFLPTVTFAIGMSAPILPPRWLGMLGLVEFYKMLYGTAVYFFQYFHNRRFEHTPRAYVWGIIVPANGYWVALPMLGMWACSRLILDGNEGVFTTGLAW